MGEMKSAFEKAMEKVEKLGSLSPEELRERKEAEYAPVGQALADKYLGHGYSRIFREAIDKYQGEVGDIVVRAALLRLREAIQIRDCERAIRATEGILLLKKGNNRVEELKEKIRNLCDESKQAEQHRYEQVKGEVEKKERDLLHQLRISGSAVGEFNLQASGIWGKVSQEVYSQFEERLENFRQELSNS